MATVTVWRFDSADGAERATATFQDLARDVAGLDAATVVWETGKGKPVARQVTTAADSLDSGFWGLLFGLIFFVPLLGAALGTATGALAGSLADVGIDDTFINRVRDQLTPGTSALVVVAADSIRTLARRPHRRAHDRGDQHRPQPAAGCRAARGLRQLIRTIGGGSEDGQPDCVEVPHPPRGGDR